MSGSVMSAMIRIVPPHKGQRAISMLGLLRQENQPFEAHLRCIQRAAQSGCTKISGMYGA